MKLHLWNNLLWQAESGPEVYCPEHRMKLDIVLVDGRILPQYTQLTSTQRGLVCPSDGKEFPTYPHSLWDLQRHFLATLEAIDLKDAEIVDVDGYQIPIAKATPPAKDSEYWAEVRINDTKRGKQLVVYAGKRGAHDKAQIFLDPEHDKISFDQNNMHPNDVFTKIVAEFDTGKKATLEQ